MYKYGLILCLLLLAGCQPAEETAIADAPPRPVKVAEAVTITAGTQYSYPAEVLAAQKAELSFRVGGQIIELPVIAMTEVKKGDLIAKLDPRDYTSNVDQIKAQIATEQSKLKTMTSGSRSEDLASMRAAISASEARVASARANAERTLTEYRKGAVPKEKLDSDLAAVKTAEAQLNADKQSLKKGKTGSRKGDVTTQKTVIKSLQTQLKNAQNVKDDAELLAPFDGIVSERLVDNFANVQPKQAIAVVQSLNNLELSFNMPGPDVARMGSHRESLKLEALLDAIPGRRFPAEVVEFSTQADERTRTFEARVAIQRPEDFSIFPGMVGQVLVTDNFKTGNTTNSAAVSVPGSAIAADSDGSPVVWVLNDESKVEMRKVELGETLDNNVTVIKGLSIGEQVVSAGVSSMIQGLAVRPVSKIGN